MCRQSILPDHRMSPAVMYLTNIMCDSMPQCTHADHVSPSAANLAIITTECTSPLVTPWPALHVSLWGLCLIFAESAIVCATPGHHPCRLCLEFLKDSHQLPLHYQCQQQQQQQMWQLETVNKLTGVIVEL